MLALFARRVPTPGEIGTFKLICPSYFAAGGSNLNSTPFRAEMSPFAEKKEISIFFASMAQNSSERASHVVSRGSVAALIPHEKSATLTQPLKENTHKSARNDTGADRDPQTPQAITLRGKLEDYFYHFITC